MHPQEPNLVGAELVNKISGTLKTACSFRISVGFFVKTVF